MIDRFNNDNEVYRTDDNLEDQEDKFGTQIGTKYVSRVPLKHFCDLEKVNVPIKIDLKIRCTLQTDIKRLFELKKKSNSNFWARYSNCICKGSLCSILTNFAHEKF